MKEFEEARCIQVFLHVTPNVVRREEAFDDTERGCLGGLVLGTSCYTLQERAENPALVSQWIAAVDGVATCSLKISYQLEEKSAALSTAGLRIDTHGPFTKPLSWVTLTLAHFVK